MKLIRIATPLIAVALMSGASFSAYAQNNQAATAPSQSWNTPPPRTEQAQSAYRDGVAAQLTRRPSVRSTPSSLTNLYDLPVKSSARDAYRASFVAGYEAAVKHSSGE